MTYEQNRSFADQFDAAWRTILAQALGPYLVVPKSEEDRQEDAGCRNYHFRDVEARVRTRRSKWCHEPNINQFTLNPYELRMILDYRIHVLGVGFAQDDTGTSLQLHYVLSVKWILDCWDRLPETRDAVQDRGDFAIYDLQKFNEPRIVIASNVEEWKEECRQMREVVKERKRRTMASEENFPLLEATHGEQRRIIEDARARRNHKKTAI
jgi:hypothetical protein